MARVFVAARLGGAFALVLGCTAALAGQPAAPPTGPVHPAATPKGNYAALNNLPDWGGVWIVAFQRRAAGAPAAPAQEPIKPKGAYKERVEAGRAYAAAHNGEPLLDVSSCTAPGTPSIMGTGQYPIEFLFTPGRVTTLHEAWTGQRRIYTDGRGHIPADELELSFYGDSIGHWEGDTLVVNTIGMKPSTKVSGVGHSPKQVVDERIHLDPNDKDVLIDEITVTDPDALEQPYKYSVRYGRHRDLELLEFICAENDRNGLGADGRAIFTQ